MAEITSITPQLKDKERCNIYVDGRFYCGLRLETAVRCRLRVPYALFEQAQRMVAAAGGKLQEPVFDDAVTLCWAIPAGAEAPLCQTLAELTRGAAAVEVSPPEYAPF